MDIAPANFVAISDGGGPATVQALTGGTITAANIFSTSPSIEQNKLVVLEDPKNTFLAANVVPLVASQKMSNDLKTVLDAVSAKLTTDALIELNTSSRGQPGRRPRRSGGEVDQGQRVRQTGAGVGDEAEYDHVRERHQEISRTAPSRSTT